MYSVMMNIQRYPKIYTEIPFYFTFQYLLDCGRVPCAFLMIWPPPLGPYMAEILLILRITLSNQSINWMYFTAMQKWKRRTLHITRFSSKQRSCIFSSLNNSFHLVRTSNLFKFMYGPSQVVAVTGHTSMLTFTVKKRVRIEDNVMMEDSLTENILTNSKKLALMPVYLSFIMTSKSKYQSVSFLREYPNFDFELQVITMKILRERKSPVLNNIWDGVEYSFPYLVLSSLFKHISQEL